MVEGGRIDHALHDTNAKRALQDTVAFDNAIKATIDKVRKTDPDLKNTLIVVTADHDHTLVLNGYAARTGKTEAGKPGVLGSCAATRPARSRRMRTARRTRSSASATARTACRAVARARRSPTR